MGMTQTTEIPTGYKTLTELMREGRHGLKLGQAVAWTHPYSNITTYGRVTKIGDRFVEIRDTTGTEGILPEWIVWRRTTDANR